MDKAEVKPDLETVRANLSNLQDQQTKISNRLAAIQQEKEDLLKEAGENRVKNRPTGNLHQSLQTLDQERTELIAQYQALVPAIADASDAHAFAILINSIESYKSTVKPANDLVLGIAAGLVDLANKAKALKELSRQQEQASNMISRRGGEAFPVLPYPTLSINLAGLVEVFKTYGELFTRYSDTPLEKVAEYKQLIKAGNAVIANLRHLQ